MPFQILADLNKGGNYADHITTLPRFLDLPMALYKISQSVSHTNELFTTEVQEVHNESEFPVFRGFRIKLFTLFIYKLY